MPDQIRLPDDGGSGVLGAALVGLIWVLRELVTWIVKRGGGGSETERQKRMHEQLVKDIGYIEKQLDRLKVEQIELGKALRELQTHPEFRVIHLDKGDG